MAQRTITLSRVVSDAAGHPTTFTKPLIVDTPELLVDGGYYLGGDADMTTNVGLIGNAQVKGVSAFRSFSAPAGSSIFPGFNKSYLSTWISQGRRVIFVVEPKNYQTFNAQTIVV